MVTTLMLYFRDSDGRRRTLKLDSPREDITEEEVLETMNLIIDRNIFIDPALVSADAASIVTVQTTELDIEQSV